MSALANIISKCKQHTRPLVRENPPHQQTRNCLTIKIWSWAPDGGVDTKIDWPTDRQSWHNFDVDFDFDVDVDFDFDFDFDFSWGRNSL
jgi:hypothetical protein